MRDVRRKNLLPERLKAGLGELGFNVQLINFRHFRGKLRISIFVLDTMEQDLPKVSSVPASKAASGDSSQGLPSILIQYKNLDLSFFLPPTSEHSEPDTVFGGILTRLMSVVQGTGKSHIELKVGVSLDRASCDIIRK